MTKLLYSCIRYNYGGDGVVQYYLFCRNTPTKITRRSYKFNTIYTHDETIVCVADNLIQYDVLYKFP